MSTTQHDVRDFAQFAERQLSGGLELTIEELFDMWRTAHPRADDLVESVAAVKAALVELAAELGVIVASRPPSLNISDVPFSCS